MKKHAEIRRELAARAARLLRHPEQITAIKPHDYQLLAIEAICNWLKSSDPSHRAYITHATGLGKTVIFSSLIQFCAGMRTLVVVPSKVLVEQTACAIVRFTGGMLGHVSSLKKIQDESGNVIAIRGHEFMDTVVTTDASFVAFGSQMVKDFDPQLIICDECHNYYTPRFQENLAKFGEAVILGFSATPDYLVVENRKQCIPVAMENGQTLYVHPNRTAATHFNKEIDARHTTWAVNNGKLCPLAWGWIDFEVNLDSVPLIRTDAGVDYNQGALYDAMADHWPVMVEAVVGVYKNHKPFDLRYRQSYAVCLRVKEAKELAEAINDEKMGITAAHITNSTSSRERRRILTAYKNREIQFLSSVMVLREGWNAPAAEVCWMLRPTQSRVLYVQAMGRCLRLDETNPDKVALIIDALFQGNRHAPLSVPKLFGTPGQEYACGDIILGKKWRGTRGQNSSPYLPKHVKPRLRVIPSLSQPEFKADQTGIFVHDSNTWATIAYWKDYFDLSYSAVEVRVEKANLEPLIGRDAVGTIREFYPQSGVEEACADLLADLPQAGADGTFCFRKQIWGTVSSLATRLGVDGATVKERIAGHSVKTRKGKDQHGRVRTFYLLAEVEKYFDDRGLSRTDNDNIAIVDGQKWLSLSRLSEEFGPAKKAILRRLQEAGVQGRLIKDVRGRIFQYYPVEAAREACEDILSDLPVAGSDGLLRIKNEIWGTKKSIARYLGISEDGLRAAFQATKTTKSGKNRSGRVCTFYKVADVKRAHEAN